MGSGVQHGCWVTVGAGVGVQEEAWGLPALRSREHPAGKRVPGGTVGGLSLGETAGHLPAAAECPGELPGPQCQSVLCWGALVPVRCWCYCGAAVNAMQYRCVDGAVQCQCRCQSRWRATPIPVPVPVHSSP